MGRAARVENILFVAICASLTCVVLFTYALAQMGVVSAQPAELVRGESKVPASSWIEIVQKYERAMERVRVFVTDFSREWFPGYDALLEANTNMTIASNRVLYDAAFGEDYRYLPISETGEGRVFLDKQRDYLFIIEPEAPMDPEGGIELINNVLRRHPDLNGYVYVVPPLWLMPFMHQQDPKFESPFYLADAIDGLDPSILRGAIRYDDLEHYLAESYKTDHHWNMAGGYRAYAEVIEMMRQVHPGIGDPLPLRPERAQVMSGFRGRLASMAAYDRPSDTISDGGIEAPPHAIYVTAPSGKIMEFSSLAQSRQELFDGTRAPGKYEDLYTSFFMPTTLYLWYDYPDNRTGRNLLVMADSTRKCIIEAMASHYDKTYAVDVRYQMDFRFDQFVREHEITDVLFMYGDTLNDLSRLYADCF